MAKPEYIPTGRTSLLKDGPQPIQVQTEYAEHPYPRITTTVSNQGQVIHKVEMKLKRALASDEEARRAEVVLARQHGEVETIIRQQTRNAAERLDDMQSSQPIDLQENTNPPQSTKPDSSEAATSPPAQEEIPTMMDRLRAIDEVRHIYHLDNNGEFFSENARAQFRSNFKKVYRNLSDLLDVFPELEGGFRREQGVVEIERDRLYFLSTGEECFFVTVERGFFEVNFEQVLKDLIIEEWV